MQGWGARNAPYLMEAPPSFAEGRAHHESSITLAQEGPAMTTTSLLAPALLPLLHAVMQGAGSPFTFFTLHCEPNEAGDPTRWTALQSIVALAEAERLAVTIELTPQWALWIAEDPAKVVQLETWRAAGHEVGGHHHHLAHPVWDGYSNDPSAAGLPGFLGNMEAYRDGLETLLGTGELGVLSSPAVNDWPFGVPHCTGGTPGAGDPISVPSKQVRNGTAVWMIVHASLTPAQLPNLMTAHNGAPTESACGVAVHPGDFAMQNGFVMEWLDFIGDSDPAGGRSRTASWVIDRLRFPGDVDRDGVTGLSDLLLLLSDWGPCPHPLGLCDSDRDGDGQTGIGDLLIVLANWAGS